jgi:hypothetical protein
VPLPEYVIGADDRSQTKLELAPVAVKIPLSVSSSEERESYFDIECCSELVVTFRVELLKFTSVVLKSPVIRARVGDYNVRGNAANIKGFAAPDAAAKLQRSTGDALRLHRSARGNQWRLR